MIMAIRAEQSADISHFPPKAYMKVSHKKTSPDMSPEQIRSLWEIFFSTASCVLIRSHMPEDLLQMHLPTAPIIRYKPVHPHP